MPNLQPFDRVEAFTVTVPAGTPSTSLHVVDTSFDPGEVVGIEISIPDGHVGLTGLQIAMASQPVIPWTPGGFIIANNETIEWSIAGQSNTGDWSAFAYNRDVFPHNFYLRFLVAENAAQLAPSQQAAFAPLNLSGLG